MSEDARLLVGQVLAGRYWLQEHLGRGQMGDVFRAIHTKVPRAFAVKVLHPQLVSDPKVCARFDREAAVAGRLRHRNVISVIDVGETAHSRYIVMELAEGPNLAQLISQGPFDAARTIRLAMQICDGLHHAHEQQLIHRDLKPENVIVEFEGEQEVPKIVDFGLAIVREGSGEDHDRLTTRGIVLGTPHYLAPETAMGKPIDRRSDLFALGVMLFEMLTGQMPFPGDGVQVATANVGAPTPTMASRAPDVDVDPLLEAVVRKLLEKRPDDRFPTAIEVHRVLGLIVEDRHAAAAALGVNLDSRRAMTQAPVAGIDVPVAGPVITEHQITTDEMDRLIAPRRGRVFAFATALVLLLLSGIVGLVLRSRSGAEPIRTEVATVEPIAPAPVPIAPVSEIAPPLEDVPVAVPPKVAARPTVKARRADPAPVAIAEPVTIAEPIVEAAPVPPDNVIELYKSLGNQLKQLSDRRDQTADDLWQRYRRIRIQQAIATSAARADAMNVLIAIEREIESRYRSPML